MAGGLVGREAELAAVERFLGEAERSNVALVLDGAPGIGKTAIWREAVARASERGLRVLTTRPAEAEARLSYGALADLVGTAYDEVRDNLPPPQRHGLDVALLQEVGDGRTDPRTICTGLVTMLHGLAANAPVLLAIDDVQWLDPASERALAFAVRRLPPRISLLVSRRSEHVAAPPLGLAEAVGAFSVERIEIGPLSLAALHHVIGAEIGAAPTRPMLVRIASTSGGNPFYALEIARMVAHDGPGIVRDAPLPISDRLHELVSARAAGISERSREVLLAVAALSRPRHAVLAAALGSPEVDEALAEAGDAGIITTDGAAIEFTHPLLASAVYTSATAGQRRRIHRRLADVVSDLEERARHLANAATVPDEATAAEVDRAAHLAASRGAQDAAADLFGAAVRLTPSDGSRDAISRLIGRSAALLAAGDPQGAQAIAESALELATDATDLAETLVLLGEIAWVESPGRQPVEYLESALAHAVDNRRRGRIHARLAEYSVLDHVRVLEHSDAAAELLDENSDCALLASALLNKAFFSAQLGYGAPHDLVERAFRLEERAGTDVERNRVGLIWLTCMDETEAARARHRIEDEWYRDRGEDGWRAERLAHFALAEFYAGDWQNAERAIEQSCTASSRWGSPPARGA